MQPTLHRSAFARSEQQDNERDQLQTAKVFFSIIIILKDSGHLLALNAWVWELEHL